MKRVITCIECPTGCRIRVYLENGKITKIDGNKCPKGETYVTSEIDNPLRILTSSVSTKGLSLKMIPVRTDKPIPKGRIFEAMDAVKRIILDKDVKSGEVIAANFLGSGANLISTRDSNP